jgi:two-component system, LytTR family, sensor kinase
MTPPFWSQLHGPLLVNTICHGIGVLAFAVLSYLFAADYRRSRAPHHLRPACASLLALVWNLGSVVNLARAGCTDDWFHAVSAISYIALSALPALLLRIALGRAGRVAVRCGYAVSAISVVLHGLDSFTEGPAYHRYGLIAIAAGFGLINLVSLLGKHRGPALAMLLFSLSYLHLGASPGHTVWLSELLLHHAAIPLILFVLLHDYRFLMLDTFVRVLSGLALGGLAVYGGWWLYVRTGAAGWAGQNPAAGALLALGACVLLLAFASLENWVQGWLTRAVFGRPDAEKLLTELRNMRAGCAGDLSYLRASGLRIAGFFAAGQSEFCPSGQPHSRWVIAATPMGSGQLLLGARRGGRRYLSEDVQLLGRLSAVVTEEISRYRSQELQALATEAELRALQAQINPHFLFNALNTLYGSIRRDNVEARKMVLNLSDVLRFALRAENRLIPLKEELRIVEAYLEVEHVRLGAKLRHEVSAEPEALATCVPALSIQPLVENAVKHGVAPYTTVGYVRLSARREGERVRIEIRNSGAIREGSDGGSGAGVGLDNVRRRLVLHFGDAASVELSGDGNETVATVTLPLVRPPEKAGR